MVGKGSCDSQTKLETVQCKLKLSISPSPIYSSEDLAVEEVVMVVVLALAYIF